MKPHLRITVQTLLSTGTPRREIERRTGVDRKTIRSYARAMAKSPGVATGFSEAAGQIPPPRPPAPDSDSVTTAPAGTMPAASACEPYRAWIEAQVVLGRNAVSIYQDLVEVHGFGHAYNSVKRFVASIRKREPERFDVLEFMPGEEAQVDYGQGALTAVGGGKYRRPYLFVMTLQLTNVISDVAGETGQKILRAIVAGERDGQVLAAMKNSRIRASNEQIAKSLQGSWRPEHLFAPKQALALFDFVASQIAECDREIEAQLERLHAHEGSPAKGKKRGRARNAPRFDLREHLFKVCGVDLTRIDGIDVTTALVVVSEVGPDMSRFPTVKHFTGWLGLCPGTKITGGKVLSGKTKRVANRASQAVRLAAAALRSSHSALGAYFRRMCSRMDKPKAVTAAAHKLARHHLHDADQRP